MDDTEIIIKMLGNDADKGAELFCMEFYNTMKSAIRTVNRNGSIILEEEDLIHDIFINFMNKDMKIIRDFKGKRNCSLSGYIYSISRRQAIKIVEKERKKNTLGSYDLDILPAKLIEDCELDKKDEIGHLSKLLEKLPSNDQLFIMCVYKYEMSMVEIIEKFNFKNRDAVYKKKHRILKRLKAKNGRDGENNI